MQQVYQFLVMNWVIKIQEECQSEEKLENIHIPLCTDVENVLTIMPEKNENDIVKVRDYHSQAMQPFMIIADFETYTNKLSHIKPHLQCLRIVFLMKITIN